ncbi:hypothetical protein ACQP1G_42015 [Nocardia sp. CA-107356]
MAADSYTSTRAGGSTVGADLAGHVSSRIYRGLFGSEERPKIEDLDI